ncbi:MAG: riboflavin synthase [Planctomycetota bacterium]|nr:riboflavin synthase [Planctomycetota bacterium]
MFTGIVQAKGSVASVRPQPAGVRLAIDPRGWRPAGGLALALGDSVCVSGVCLTLASLDAGQLHFDVINETLTKTTLGSLGAGQTVNLEPSLTANTPMGGHFMQGHVDGVGVVSQIKNDPGDWRVTVTPPAELADYVIPKGSIAIDGVSLTLASTAAGTFDVALIPTTLKLTTLGDLRVGSRVNLEADILAKTVVHYLRRVTAGGSGAPGVPRSPADAALTLDGLRRAGFTP